MCLDPTLLGSSTRDVLMPLPKNQDDWKNQIWMDLQRVLEPILMKFLRRSAGYGVPDDDSIRDAIVDVFVELKGKVFEALDECEQNNERDPEQVIQKILKMYTQSYIKTRAKWRLVDAFRARRIDRETSAKSDLLSELFGQRTEPGLRKLLNELLLFGRRCREILEGWQAAPLDSGIAPKHQWLLPHVPLAYGKGRALAIEQNCTRHSVQVSQESILKHLETTYKRKYPNGPFGKDLIFGLEEAGWEQIDGKRLTFRGLLSKLLEAGRDQENL